MKFIKLKRTFDAVSLFRYEKSSEEVIINAAHIVSITRYLCSQRITLGLSDDYLWHISMVNGETIVCELADLDLDVSCKGTPV